MSATSDMIRTTFSKTDAERNQGLKTPEDILRYDNIRYGKDTKWQILDVYRPAKSGNTLLPVIVNVHGGAWVYSDKEQYQFYCMDLAERGFSVVNFTYRLAPESKFPACLEDTCNVFSWVLEHAQEYGFDRRYVFGVGDSAGAHILGLFTAMCVNSDYAKRFSFSQPSNFVPRALAMNCGIYTITMSDKPEDILFTKLVKDFMPEKGTEEELHMINVLEHISETFPPTFLMTSEGDFLKKHTAILAERLLEKKIPFIYEYFRDNDISLGHVFHLDIRLDMAGVCNNETCNFFRRYIK